MRNQYSLNVLIIIGLFLILLNFKVNGQSIKPSTQNQDTTIVNVVEKYNFQIVKLNHKIDSLKLDKEVVGESFKSKLGCWNFFNSRLFSTMLTLAFGVFFLSIWNSRREKNNKRYENKLAFLEETSLDLNNVVSKLFWAIRSNSPKDQNNELVDEINKLYLKRFSVKIKSLAFLRDEEFAKRYNRLTKELSQVRMEIKNLNQNDSEKSIKSIDKYRNDLVKDWQINNEPYNENPKFTVHQIELLKWMHEIYDRSVNLLTKHLK